MDCIAILLPSPDLVQDIVESADAAGIFINQSWEFDSENEPGLRFASEKFKSNHLIRLLGAQRRGKYASSANDLMMELGNFYLHNKQSRFINFIDRLQLSEGVEKRMTIVFCSDWDLLSQPVRIVLCELEDLKGFFKTNYSWQITTFDLENKRDFTDLDTPILFRIGFSNVFD